MLTNNTEITAEDIGFVCHDLVKCGNAYIINVANIGEPFASTFDVWRPSIKGKKFLLFTCCESQEQNAKDNIKEIVSICNEMIKNNDAVFIANPILDESEPPGYKQEYQLPSKRTLH